MNTCAEGYIDDILAITEPVLRLANDKYIHMRLVTEELGLQANPDKCEPPATRMTWTGVTFDMVEMTMSVCPV